jgi:ABC-type Fe3+/spermidine/putrescine transport system ATPase subunit
MMFQDFALFPHRTVAENVAFGLKMEGVPKREQQMRVAEMLELVGLEGYNKRSIFELSGGEQQRVALARSLAPRPPLLMLDEPLGSLDRTLRERLMDELRSILKTIGMTSLYVTHDQQEAFAISDRLVLINKGQKVQEGTPEELYRQPVNRFAAEFFGLRNYLPITQVQRLDQAQQYAKGTLWQAITPLGTLHLVADSPSNTLLIRPEAAQLVQNGEREQNIITGHVLERSFRGGHYRLVSSHKHQIRLEWELTTPDHDLPKVGDPIRLALRPDAITFLPSS